MMTTWLDQTQKRLEPLLREGSHNAIREALLEGRSAATPDAVIFQPGMASHWVGCILKVLCYRRDQLNEAITLAHLVKYICAGKEGGGAESLLHDDRLPEPIIQGLRSYYDGLPEDSKTRLMVEMLHQQTFMLLVLGYSESPTDPIAG